MERVAVRFVLTAAVVGLLACNKNVDRDAELVISKPGESGTAPLSAEGGGVLEGTVSIAPALAAKAGGAQVLFLIARRPEGGPPLAVRKIVSPTFPLNFQLTNKDVMMEGFELSGQVLVGARLDADGAAGPAAAGDMMGVTPSPVMVGGPSVDLVIDQEFGAEAPATTVKLPEAPPGDTMAARQAALTGTIQLDPSLAAEVSSHPALFIIARSGAGGPPLAAQRIATPSFPYSFRMTAQDVMMQGREFSGQVTITARLDADGAAGPAASGDLTGSTAAPVEIGGPDVEIVINQRVP